MMADWIWNALSIGSRVFALVPFAVYKVHWFWYIGGIHVVVMTVVIYFLHHSDERRDTCKLISWNIALSAWAGFGCLFNFCSYARQPIRFPVYLLYWLIMFTENTVMISLCYHWNNDLDKYYWVVYFIVLYLLALVIECLHAYFYNGRKRVRDICGWHFYPGLKNRDDKVNTGLSQSKI